MWTMHENLLETRTGWTLTARSQQPKELRQWLQMGLWVIMGRKVHLHASVGAVLVLSTVNLEWGLAFSGTEGM